MRIVFLLLITILFIPKLHSIEVSSLEAERRLKFNELFPKKICDKIYKDINFGSNNKLEEEIMVMAYHNLKRIKINETDSSLSLFFDNRTYSYNSKKLDLIIFNNLSDDFSDQITSITKKISKAKTKKIVVCEYDLEKSIENGKFFNLRINFDNSLRNISNEKPKVLIYYDGTIEYNYYDEQIDYSIPQFDYKTYPFDSHDFKFLVSSRVFENLFFEKSDKFEILLNDIKKFNFNNISFPGWTIKQYISYPSIEPLKDAYSEYSKHSISSEISIERNWLTYLYKFVVPLLIITILCYACMYMTLNHGRATLLGTLLVSFVAFNFVLVDKVPELPYITFLDWIIFMGYMISVLVILAMCIESFYLSHFYKSDEKKFSNVTIAFKIIIPIMYLLLGATGYYLII